MKQYHFYETLCSLTLASGLLIGCSSSSDLKWNHEKNYRWAEIEPGYFGSTGFELLESSHTNIHFINRVTEEEIGENRHYLNGSGVAAGDIDGDGLVDLYFAGLGESNRLYKNLGGMRFKDITDQAGVAHKGYYSTGVVFADVNGDRDLDLLVTSMHRENVLYTNDGNGKFELKEDSGLGPAKGSMTMALADIDGDLDLDLYIANYKEKTVKDLYTTEELEWDNILNEPYNEQKQAGPYTLASPFDRHYELFLTHDNNFAGAAETGKEDELYINRGGTFEKITDTKKVFLNEHGEPYGLQPDWGLTAKFQDLNGDGLPDLYVCNDFFTKDRIWINQGGGIFKAIEWQAIRNMSFACMGVDFSDINRDGLLDIFTTEMLSPEHNRRLQQVGSNDPLPIRIGQVKSLPTYNRNSMYLKREDNTYSEISYLSGTEATGWSWDATFMDVNLDGYEDLLVSTGYLYGILDIDAQMEMIRRGRNMDEHFTEYLREAPPLDLPNRILMNNGDLTFQEKSLEWGFGETDISQGMAVADLNNDGIFNDVSVRAGLSAYKGWWNGIATGDFNNDGYQDIVATNRGLNSSYQLRENKPLRMYYDDFNRDGRVDIIEAYAAQNGDYVPRKRLYEFQSLPMIAGRMESHQQFANTTLKGIFGALLPGIPYKEINTLEHMIFINTGRGFEAHPLPKQAQFSAAFYAGVADVDNDGNEDLFLSQNFFAVPGQAPRLDAGRGLWLKGDGNVGMEAVPGNLSGIKIYGEQRGAALGDFNRDGKVDLAVSQNGAETKLYINRTGERGLRIKLCGPPQNMDGIGSGIRLVYKDGDKGPGREVQSGSGYWSQNSFTQVMGMEKEPDKIVVTWFDGTIQTVNVTENLQNYTINYEDVR